MYSKGKFHSKGKDYDALVNYTKSGTEVLLISKGTIVSAYKTDKTGNYSFASMAAQDLFKVVSKGLGYCNSKNGTPMPFVGLGAVTRHEFSKMKLHYDITEINHELVECDISNNETDDNGRSKMTLSLSHIYKAIIPNNIAYVKLTEVKDVKTVENAEEDLDNIVTRSIEEIALTKEDGGAWLKNKKYYIVNDDATAEQIFEYLDNYDGAIAYDTETTGLKINCFGKVGSHYEKELAEYNASHPDEKIREDRLVGIIFCVEPNVSYYFPVFNRKFKNLYQDLNSPIRKKTVEIIKARYTTGEFKDRDSDMANYIRNTPENEWRLDVILMERVRDILSKKHIVTHGGIFEWRVGWTYEIDTNICDDTMIIHQLIYKFRSTTSNAGEPSNLKYLAKHDLGVDQWELKDFFPNFKADDTGLVKERKDGKGPKKGSRIDFSYMDYAGTQIYAPADGDMTLELYLKYKKDMLEHFKDFEYIYNIEIIVTCAMGYVEFYGHRINESKINGARLQTAAEIVDVEEQIRQAINYASQDEINVHNQLKTVMAEAEKGDVNDPAISGKLDGLAKKLRETIDANTDHALNINSPAQVAALFFDVLGYPDPDGKRSVSKKVYKGLAKEVGDDGKLKYPIAGLYQKYKAKVTLQTKFFDQLQYFQYPEGLIFSDFGQISTATGRMSCKHPNCIAEGTKITTVGGEKNIEDIKPGDLVYCYDNDGSLRVRPVIRLIDNGNRDCIDITWKSTGNDNNGHLICTPDHKILSKDRGWIEASELDNNERVFHLTRSNEDRPRLFGVNGISEQEQLVIKHEVFRDTDPNNIIHHIDENTRNNSIDNLMIMTRQDHSHMHANELVAEGRIKYAHLAQYSEYVPRGEEHPKYRHETVESLRQMLIDADCKLTNIPMDFDTYKKKCRELGFDYKAVIAKLHPRLRDVDPEELYNSYVRNCGVTYRIANDLNIGRAKVDSMIREIGLNEARSNHDVNSIEFEKDFFELNGDIHKLSNKYNITIRETQQLVKTLNLVITGISDDEFIRSFTEHHGKLKGVADELGITRYKASMNARRLNLAYNHRIISINKCGKHRVYDLEIDGIHNFIANEICVHNCQQYPKVITKIVEPRPGYIMLDADYSQIEYRVLTALAHNSGLRELFSSPDSDYHTLMASLMYGVPYASVTPQMRSSAKSFNFGIPYGMGFKSLAILLHGNASPESVDDAKVKYEMYFKNQPNTRKFFDNVKEQAQVYGYTKTAFNRRRYYNFTSKDGTVNNAKKAAALRQAGNAVIQGSAADIFKISLARNFTFIRNHNLYGKLLIINLIHDEQLMEVDVQHLNAQRILAEVGRNMQFSLPEFPPLYIGAGIGKAWGTAKGKMAEIHPLLLEQYTKEAINISIERTETTWNDPNKVIEYFDNRNLEFRRKKVADYITDPSHWDQPLHPAIGGLINLQFNYGRGGDAKAYVDENGNHVTDAEFLEMNLADFIKENGLNVDPHTFFEDKDQVQAETQDEEEDKEYDDDDDENPDDIATSISDDPDKVFSVVDESDKTFGSSLQDIISVFGCCLLENQRVCGIDLRGMSNKGRNSMIDALCEYVCEPTDSKGLQLVFLKDGNILDKTGVYVSGINGSTAEAEYKKFKALH